MRTIDAVVPALIVPHPIRIRRAANMVGHGSCRWINRVCAKVRHVPFERRAHFRVGACPRIIRCECRAIDSHHMRRHVPLPIIEELTHDMLTQRIPNFTRRRARFVGHESPRTNQVRQGICIHTSKLICENAEVPAEFFYAPICRTRSVRSYLRKRMSRRF